MYNSVAFYEMHRRLTNGNEHENIVVEPRYRYQSSIDMCGSIRRSGYQLVVLI